MAYLLLTYLFTPVIYLLLHSKKREARRILIVQTAKIGDLVYSTPVFRAIKKQYPNVHLSVLVNPITREILEHNPYINEIISLDNGSYKGFTGKVRLTNLFRNGRYDIALLLNPNVPFALAMFWGLIPVRLSIMSDFSGITYRMASVFCTYLEKHIRGRLVAETYLKMLKAIGIEDNDISKDVFKSPDADERVKTLLTPAPQFPTSKLIGLAVTSGNRLKEWGTENMTALAEKLITGLGARIILIGSEKDRDVSDEILRLAEHKSAIIDTVGKLKLAELPALIERLSLLIGVDTGSAYMADALNIPLVDIAGPSDMEDQRPTGRKVVIIQKNLPCVPCSHTFKAPYECRYGHRECITAVTVEEVFQGASKLLG